MSDYSTHSLCCGIKALGGLWSIIRALVNQINLKMTSCIIMPGARAGGRDPNLEKISVELICPVVLTGLFLAGSPLWILVHSHSFQLGIDSKVRSCDLHRRMVTGDKITLLEHHTAPLVALVWLDVRDFCSFCFTSERRHNRQREGGRALLWADKVLTIRLCNTKEGDHLGQMVQVDEGRCNHIVQPSFCATPPCNASEAVSSSETWHQHPVLPAHSPCCMHFCSGTGDGKQPVSPVSAVEWGPAWLLSLLQL